MLIALRVPTTCTSWRREETSGAIESSFGITSARIPRRSVNTRVLNKALAERFRDDREAYTRAKADFISAMLERARAPRA